MDWMRFPRMKWHDYTPLVQERFFSIYISAQNLYGSKVKKLRGLGIRCEKVENESS
jgi:hypothetical protein